MQTVKSFLIGLITFILITFVLIIGFGTLTIINIPRIIIPFKFFKIFLAKVSNQIGDITVYGLKLIMLLMHGNTIQVINEQKFDSNTWYMAMSNHQSWADIFVLLVTANHPRYSTKIQSIPLSSQMLSEYDNHMLFYKNSHHL